MLPIGFSSLRTIRERNCYYVDKTDHALRLVEGGAYYFLSRPRRFGKTLLVDTLQKLFEGSEELFRDLAVHGGWDWSARHPVVRLDFSGVGDFDTPDGARGTVEAQLAATERRAGLEPGPAGAAVRFRELIAALHERTGQQVVVLVDEYDKPILDVLDSPDMARANRDFLRGFYAMIKDCDRQLRFVFLTGVSKFSQAGLFSGLNNLRDITLAPEFSAICGYTDDDLDAVFAPELEGLDREEVRRWYNGYNWRGAEMVYNPFDVLLLFQTREFKAHWFETGTPGFLVDLLSRRRIATPALEDMVADDALLSAFDVDDISTEALLFQTGYLTIVGEEVAGGGNLYRLDYPNHEVKLSLNRRLLRVMAPVTGEETTRRTELERLTAEDDPEGVRALFEAFFAGIPYDWYRRNDIAHGYWAGLVYSHFAAAGMDVRVEEMTARGRLDMAVLCPGHVHLYEFKMVERGQEGNALAQLREKGYADKYRRPGVPIRLIAMEFSREERNIVGFAVETA